MTRRADRKGYEEKLQKERVLKGVATAEVIIIGNVNQDVRENRRFPAASKGFPFDVTHFCANPSSLFASA